MKRCPDCHRVDDEIGTCGRSTVPCPPSVTVRVSKDVVINCAPCDKTRAFPIAPVIAGRELDLQFICGRDVESCKCIVVRKGVEA